MPLMATISSASIAKKIETNRKQIIKVCIFILVGTVGLSILGAQFVKSELWLTLGSLYLLWNTWHFSAQNFGVLSLYRGVSNQNSILDRKVDKYFCLFMGCVLQPIIWLCIEARWGPIIKLLPRWSHWDVVINISLGVAVATCISYIIYELKKANRSYQKIGYALSISIQSFAGVWGYYPFHFLAYSVPHWLVEIGITGTIQANDVATSKKFKKYSKIAVYFGVLMALIFLLEPFTEDDGLVLNWWETLTTTNLSDSKIVADFSLATIISILILPRSFIHFYISRQIYKSTRWTIDQLKHRSEGAK